MFMSLQGRLLAVDFAQKRAPQTDRRRLRGAMPAADTDEVCDVWTLDFILMGLRYLHLHRGSM